jgi:hypothetical protein
MLRENQVLIMCGHSQLESEHSVCSAMHKHLYGRILLQWVNTWESLLLYVFLLHKDLSQHVCIESIRPIE